VVGQDLSAYPHAGEKLQPHGVRSVCMPIGYAPSKYPSNLGIPLRPGAITKSTRQSHEAEGRLHRTPIKELSSETNPSVPLPRGSLFIVHVYVFIAFLFALSVSGVSKLEE
jgi:hypothetical protein